MKNNRNQAFEVIQTLNKNGYEAYLAGGCVRDELLGLEPSDYDVATSALPDRVEEIFPKHVGFAKKFGVIVVIFSEKITVEVTTFRKDFDYTDGRRPSKIIFGNILEDCYRRDFTINALYKDIVNDKIIDLCGGLEDLDNKILKAVGEPFQRFEEDKLRIMRAVRFSGNLGFEIEKKTCDAIKFFVDKIDSISYERINEELTKMITKKNAHKCLRKLFEFGILEKVLPELSACSGVEQPPEFHPEGDVLEHTLKMFELAEYPLNKILAFSMLFHDIGKPLTYTVTDRIRFNGHDKAGAELAEKVMRRLKFSNNEIREIKYIVSNHMKFMEVKNMRKAKLKKMISSQTFFNELELHRLDCISSHAKLDNYEFLIEKKNEFSELEKIAKPIITGKNLIDKGLQPSKIFKKLIDDCYNYQLDNDITDRKVMLDYLNKIFF